MSEIKPIILIVSDIHVGSLDCEIDLFIQFLRKIINGVFGNELQTLIIMGDFLDLCTDVPANLLQDENVQEIFTLLLKIKESLNLIFLLGNHEIPVTGDYDEKFKRREKKFLIKFKKLGSEDLFAENLYYQYIILKKNNNEDQLFLYETRDQINRNPLAQIKVKGLELGDDFECLMAHGFQFDSEIYRFFVGQLWKALISKNKFEIKETYDYFWNLVIKNGRKIKPITFKQMKEELAKVKSIPMEEIDQLFSELSILEFNLIKVNMRIMKKWERASKPDYYNKEIKEFLEDDGYKLSKINHVIYGHSHIKGITYENINNTHVSITNSGSWQHMQPSYVEIQKKGKIILKLFNQQSIKYI